MTLHLLAAAIAAFAVNCCGIENASATERKHVTPEEFKRLFGEEEFRRLVQEAENKLKNDGHFSINQEGSVVRFSGLISPEAATALSRVLSNDEVDELWVESDGGYVEAGHQIGRLIRQRGLKVVVTGACISSCANYLFTAGKQRAIRSEGFVVWHGSTFQKDGREFDKCGRVRSSLDDSIWTPDEIAERRQDADGVKRRQQADLEFFATVGVDEYITRVGQEPRFFGNFTLIVQDMAFFGLTGVDAPADYGSTSFCHRVNARRPTLQLSCVKVADDMVAYERARRALGEICAPDGSLVIATRAARAAVAEAKR